MKNNPFNIPGRFYRGNLHTHSTGSDGKHSVGEVIRRYREAGYDFLSISDHFREIYDYPITDTRDLRSDGFTTLIAAELHASEMLCGDIWHILAVGLPVDFPPLKENETIFEVTRRAADAGAFIGICHPSWSGLTVEEAYQIDCAHAVEIYNHGSKIEVERGEDIPFWENMLNSGHHLSGYATDDAHRMTHDCFGGWIHVKAASLDPELLLKALKAGHYYSSQGPQINSMDFDGDELTVTCSPVDSISLQGLGQKNDRIHGKGLVEATFDISQFKASHLRLTLRDADGKRAWSNPIWFD